MENSSQARSRQRTSPELSQEIERLHELGASQDDIHRFLVIEGRPDSLGVIQFCLALNNLGRLILKGAEKG